MWGEEGQVPGRCHSGFDDREPVSISRHLPKPSKICNTPKKIVKSARFVLIPKKSRAHALFYT
jgi:hypothetical protein